MGTVLTFTPRPRSPEPTAPPPLSDADLRTHIEAEAQAALDVADRLIALLDRIDGDTDFEDGGDAEPTLAAPENLGGSQVAWLRGGDQDREAEAAETVLQDVVIEALPWGGNGNVVAAAGVMLLEMVAGRGCRLGSESV